MTLNCNDMALKYLHLTFKCQDMASYTICGIIISGYCSSMSQYGNKIQLGLDEIEMITTVEEHFEKISRI